MYNNCVLLWNKIMLLIFSGEHLFNIQYVSLRMKYKYYNVKKVQNRNKNNGFVCCIATCYQTLLVINENKKKNRSKLILIGDLE